MPSSAAQASAANVDLHTLGLRPDFQSGITSLDMLTLSLVEDRVAQLHLIEASSWLHLPSCCRVGHDARRLVQRDVVENQSGITGFLGILDGLVELFQV